MSEKLFALGVGGGCPVRRRETIALARTEFGFREDETVVYTPVVKDQNSMLDVFSIRVIIL